MVVSNHVFWLDLQRDTAGAIKVGPTLSECATLTTVLKSYHEWKVVSARVVYQPQCGANTDGALSLEFDMSCARSLPDGPRFVQLGKRGQFRMAKPLLRCSPYVGTGSDYLWLPYKVSNSSSRICGRVLVYLTVSTLNPK
jgi:hypothetical protein